MRPSLPDYRDPSHEVAGAPRPVTARSGSPVVTGRIIGLQASDGKRSAKDFLRAGVMTGW